jgi:hypothetical protein
MVASYKHQCLIFLLILLLTDHVFAQDTISSCTYYPAGVFVNYSLGRYGIKDQYISGEKYSGTLPCYDIGWARRHEKYVYKLEMALRNSKDIHNNNVSTEITQMVFNQGFLYPLGKIPLHTKDLYLWLGPSTELFFNYNKPFIAVSGFDYAQSYAGMFSLGFRLDAVCPVGQKWLLETFVNTTALSLALRSVDEEEDNRSPAKLLTLFSGIHASVDLGARYYLSKKLSLRLAYRLEYVRIHAWEPLLSASDNIVVGLNYRFKN